MRRTTAAVAGLVLALTAVGVVPATATAPTTADPPRWARAATAPIHPGVQVRTERGQCTSNFVFSDGTDDLYLGVSAHCVARTTDSTGCAGTSLPLGTPVEVEGATRPARLVYSSWRTMARVGEVSPRVCRYNDFALLRLDRADHQRTNPSVPHWGGPVSLAPGELPALSLVYGFGASGIRAGLEILSPKVGVSLGSGTGSWTRPVYLVTPGIPGDSGSVLLNANGRAVGMLSTLMLMPLPLANQYTDLGRSLAYARTHTDVDVSLVPGTRPFRPQQLPVMATSG